MKSNILSEIKNSFRNLFLNSNYNLLRKSRYEITELMKNYKIFKNKKLDEFSNIFHDSNNSNTNLNISSSNLIHDQNLTVFKNLDNFLNLLKNMNDHKFLNEINWPNINNNELIDYLEILNEKDLFINNENSKEVNINECSFTLSLGLFCLNPLDNLVKLDFHDHPGMFVFSKCLMGELNISKVDKINNLDEKIFDLSIDNTNINNNGKNNNSIKLNRGQKIPKYSLSYKNLKNGEYTELYPDLDNIHSISTSQKSILLDFFIPHYDLLNECSYYEIVNNNNNANIIIKKL